MSFSPSARGRALWKSTSGILLLEDSSSHTLTSATWLDKLRGSTTFLPFSLPQPIRIMRNFIKGYWKQHSYCRCGSLSSLFKQYRIESLGVGWERGCFRNKDKIEEHRQIRLILQTKECDIVNRTSVKGSHRSARLFQIGLLCHCLVWRIHLFFWM